jgi:hypothetical protein
MSAGDYRTEHLMRGNLDLRRNAETGTWRLAWSPHYGEPDWPGHCYSPGDWDLPGDYPPADDLDALIKWGRRHFGP